MEYLWSDRRRRLGLPLSFTRYALSEDRLFVETGLLTTQCEEILLYRVRDLSLRITLGQRIFGVGTVTIQSSDRSCPVLELKNVKHPRETKEIIHQAVENMKGLLVVLTQQGQSLRTGDLGLHSCISSFEKAFSLGYVSNVGIFA